MQSIASHRTARACDGNHLLITAALRVDGLADAVQALLKQYGAVIEGLHPPHYVAQPAQQHWLKLARRAVPPSAPTTGGSTARSARLSALCAWGFGCRVFGLGFRCRV
jgi:hypothetical protein